MNETKFSIRFANIQFADEATEEEKEDFINQFLSEDSPVVERFLSNLYNFISNKNTRYYALVNPRFEREDYRLSLCLDLKWVGNTNDFCEDNHRAFVSKVYNNTQNILQYFASIIQADFATQMKDAIGQFVNLDISYLDETYDDMMKENLPGFEDDSQRF